MPLNGLPSPWARDPVACSKHDAGWSTPAMTSTATTWSSAPSSASPSWSPTRSSTAIPPIKVRVRGTWEHPRVEVIDGSTEPPILPGSEPLGDDDDLLLTFGRGLGIVARCSTAWGAEIEDDGKVVWFVPAARAQRGRRRRRASITGRRGLR